MHSLLQPCHGAENHNQEWCLNTQLLVTSCIHLWPNFYLTLTCTHSPGLLWKEPFKFRTITAPLFVSLAGSCWCSLGTHVFKGIHHTQQYHTWPLPPQNPSLPQSSLCLTTSYSALSSWLTYILELFRVLFPPTNSQSHSKERKNSTWRKDIPIFHPIKKAVSIHLSLFITDKMQFTAKIHRYRFFKVFILNT